LLGVIGRLVHLVQQRADCQHSRTPVSGRRSERQSVQATRQRSSSQAVKGRRHKSFQLRKASTTQRKKTENSDCGARQKSPRTSLGPLGLFGVLLETLLELLFATLSLLTAALLVGEQFPEVR